MITELDDNKLKSIADFGIDFSNSSCPLGKKAKTLQLTESPKEVEILKEAYTYWMSLEKIRTERRRNLRYKNGDQWSDYIEDPDHRGRIVKEETVLSRGGKTPLKHNFIQQFVRNITGQMSSTPSQSIVNARSRSDVDLSEMLTNTLQAVLHLNKIDKINIATIEELLLCGISSTKVRYAPFPGREYSDGKVDHVNINRLFFNTDIEDPRMDDLRVIGEFHDYTLLEAISNFADSAEDEQQIKQLFGVNPESYASLYGMSIDKMASVSFFPTDNSKCRVYEIWTKEGRWVNYIHDQADGTEETTTLNRKAVNEINKRRKEQAEKLNINLEQVPLIKFHTKFEHYWCVRFMSITGDILRISETPYTHGSHPYVLCTMPIVDGEFRGVLSDLIDMQRYINRLIVMQDFMMGTSAKGVLMVPESAIPDGYSVSDFAEEYVKIDGVILYKNSMTGEKPYQVSRNATDPGIERMLAMQMRLMSEISGLSGAIQGQVAAPGTPSSLYAQQASNSLINHKTLFDTMTRNECDRDEKLLKVILQFYSEPRNIANTRGSRNMDNATTYLPSLAGEVESFNLVVSQSIDTPVYRQLHDEVLLSMLRQNQIPVDIYLENSSLPFAEKILSQLKNREESKSNNDELNKIMKSLLPDKN